MMHNTYVSPNFRSHLSTFWAMVHKELIVITRYPIEFFASFGQIFLIVAIFSLAGLTFSPTGQSSEGISGVVVYGFILFMFISDTMWTIGYNIRQEQVQGTLEQLYLSPANKFASLISRVVNLLLWTSMLSILAALVMKSLLGSLPTHNFGLGMVLLALNLLGTFGIGFAFAALTLRIRETASTLANLFQFVYLIFGASFFPFAALPDWMQTISKLLPITYGVDIFRSTMMGYPPGFPELAPIETELWVTTIFGLTMPLIGFWLYRRAEHRAREKGTLTAY